MGNIPTYRSHENLTVAEPHVPLFSRDAIDGVSELARHYEKRQMQDDLVTVLDVEQKFSQWQDAYLDHPESGLLARRGADARGGYGTFVAEAARKFLALNDNLENPTQRALFEKRYQDRLARAQDRVAAHEANEVDVHRRRVLGEASITETRRAIELINAGDTDGAGEAMDMASRFLGQSLSGVPAYQQDEARRLLVSGFHGAVFNQRLDEDPIAAEQYLSANRKAIDPVIYERLQQTANRRIETVQGRELFETVYNPQADLSDILTAIDASDAPDPQKSIARDLAEDRWEIVQAEQFAFEMRQTQAIEDATYQAVLLIDDGASFEALPDEVMDILPPDYHRAVRTHYVQKISGQPAPYNAALENDLHDYWIRAINGDSAGFLTLPLAPHLGSHNRDRLELWGRRQAGLKTADTKYMAEVNRRKLAMTTASGFVERVVEAQGGDAPTRARLKGRLNEAATSYIFNWYEAHPDQVMEPKALLDNLGALVGPEPTGRTIHPQQAGFMTMEGQTDVVGAAAEQDTQEGDGRLPNAIVKALQEPRMDAPGFWFAKDSNAQANENGNLIGKAGELLTDGDGNPVDLAFPDQNIWWAANDPAADDNVVIDEVEDAEIPDDELNDLEKAANQINENVLARQQNGQATADELLDGISKEALTEMGEAVLSVLPGTGNVLSARDAVVALLAAQEAAKQGDVGEVAIQGALLALGVGGAVPGAGILVRAAKRLAKGLAEKAAQMGFSKGISLRKSNHPNKSLSNRDARYFYTGRLKKAKRQNKEMEDPEARAKDAHNIRNKERTLARDKMSDQKKRAEMDRDNPNMTWDEVVKKYEADGFRDKGLHDIIRKKAFNPNKEVTKGVKIKAAVETKKN
ncbi:MAG: hypothetical protein HQ483_18350 [Rhodospirillales bacterium]|nr:hypothetical protein [Rhodospirillales bacterium]